MAKSNSKAGSLRSVFALLLLFGPALILIFISTRGCEHKFKELDDYGPIPAFSFTDARGKVYTNNSFKNKIVIYTTIQPSCPDSCGVTIWHLDQLIYQRLRENKKRLGHVKIVSVLTDGIGNPDKRLKDVEYMLKDRVEGFDPSIWIIVTGDAKSLYNIKHNGQTLLQEDKKYFGGFGFQELMLLSDKSNHLRMVLPGKTESTIRTMRDHMALLEKEYDIKAYKLKKKKEKA
ncbi:SCO family protein [Fluviicola sp.]|uniref:SCO family protein n=1 Tax=Fluviicola sp. TaxID=1917219 RepID=UPI0031E2D83C